MNAGGLEVGPDDEEARERRVGVGSTIEASAAATVEELKAISETVKGMTQ